MYAAGHPPLPPLEVMTYSRDEPSHAKLPDKNEYITSLNADDAWKLFHYRKGESSARQVAVGAAVGFREAMKTLATKAEDAEAGKGEGPILDFALFDCAACHHDLAVPSWRADGRTVPGRATPGMAMSMPSLPHFRRHATRGRSAHRARSRQRLALSKLGQAG
jgi:hypothetical protein